MRRSRQLGAAMALAILLLSPAGARSAPYPAEIEQLGIKALQLVRSGQYLQALPLWERLQQWQYQHLGPSDPRRLRSLRNLAGLYLGAGQPKQAAEAFQRHLEQVIALHGSSSLESVAASLDLAKALRTLARFEAAEALTRPALDVLATMPSSPETITLRAHGYELLGVIAHERGLYPLAEQEHRRALSLRRSLPSTLPDLTIANSTANVAQAVMRQGRFAQALDLELEAMRLYRSLPQLESRGQRSTVLANIGLTHDLLGNRSGAIAAMQEALPLRLEVSGPSHPETARLLLNLGALEVAAGDPARGLSRSQQALSILEQRMGPEHISTAFAIQRLADLSRDQGQVARAEGLYQRTLRIRRRQLRPDHPDLATTLLGLALTELQQQRPDAARHDLQEALRIRRSAFGPHHPYTANTELLLGLLRWEQAADPEAVEHLRAAGSAYAAFLQGEAALLPVQERRRLMATVQESRNVLHGLALQGEAGTQLALEARLNLQGLLEELERRQADLLRRNPQRRNELAALNSMTTQLAGIDQSDRERERLMQRRDALERALFRQLKDGQPSTGWLTSQRIAQALPKDGVLVEFLRYDPVRFRSGSLQTLGAGRYAALILQADGRSSAVDLGPAETINRAIWQALIHTQRIDLEAPSAWNRVRALVIEPLLPSIGRQRRWFLSLDGELHRVPFAALGPLGPNGLEPLGDRHRIHLLTSARELLASAKPGKTMEVPLVLADPDFDAPQKEDSAPIPAEADRGQELPVQWRDQRWSRLPGTRAEGAAVALLTGASLRTGPEARTRAITQRRTPLILHIASHGAFLPDPERGTTTHGSNRLETLEGKGPIGRDPMLRSVVLLAGANRRGVSSDDDGLLTALEVSKLDLEGTQLVTLSACDTGKGSIELGNGVYGLRRGIAVAGAESSLLSLWKVSDQETNILMQAFYRHLNQGLRPEQALLQSQQELRRHPNGLWRHPYYWAAFQLYGRSW